MQFSYSDKVIDLQKPGKKIDSSIANEIRATAKRRGMIRSLQSR